MKFISTIALSILASGLYASAAVLRQCNMNMNALQVETMVICPDRSKALPFWRSYNPALIDHFYTTNVAEHHNAIGNLGYSNEGVSGYIFPNQEPGTVPLFRSYNALGGDHFYTTNAAERDNAVKNGWAYEGVAGFIFPDGACGAVPFYRLYSGGGIDHFYTTSASERDNASLHLGYSQKGVAGYIYP